MKKKIRTTSRGIRKKRPVKTVLRARRPRQLKISAYKRTHVRVHTEIGKAGGFSASSVRVHIPIFYRIGSPLLRFLKKGVGTTALFLLSLLLTVSLVRAGTLSPSASPTSTAYSLSDLYTRLTTNATATSGNHSFTAPASVTGTLYSLSDLYNAIPTIAATSVVSGTTYLGISGTYNTSNLTTSTVATGTIFGVSLRGTLYGDTSSSRVCSTATYAGTLSPGTGTIQFNNTICGISGTLLQNLFNGTGQGWTGGTQASGGITDLNGTSGNPPSNRYVGTWTDCTAGNNYCGTGLTSADIKQESTGLVWSFTCSGSGCSTLSSVSSTYTWDSSGANNNSKTASQLCSSGSHSESGWSLPHQKQWMQASVDGMYGNIDPPGTSQYYWTATSYSGNTSTVFATRASDAVMEASAKTLNYRVRCVR